MSRVHSTSIAIGEVDTDITRTDFLCRCTQCKALMQTTFYGSIDIDIPYSKQRYIARKYIYYSSCKYLHSIIYAQSVTCVWTYIAMYILYVDEERYASVFS